MLLVRLRNMDGLEELDRNLTVRAFALETLALLNLQGPEDEVGLILAKELKVEARLAEESIAQSCPMVSVFVEKNAEALGEAVSHLLLGVGFGTSAYPSHVWGNMSSWKHCGVESVFCWRADTASVASRNILWQAVEELWRLCSCVCADAGTRNRIQVQKSN